MSEQQEQEPGEGIVGQSASTAGLELYTPESLRKWGAALDREMPNGLGESLLCIAYDWRESIESEREACAKVCEAQAEEPECQERAQYCADAIRMRSNDRTVGPDAALSRQVPHE